MSAELKSEIQIIDFDLSELSSLELTAKRPNVKTLLANETNRLTQKKNQLLKQLKELSANETKPAANTGIASGGQPSMGTVAVTNYMWDQTNEFVKIYIELEKNYSLDSTQIQMSFPTNKSFSVIFGKYKFGISKLFDQIDVQNSYHKFTKSGKVIFYLKKSSPKQWSTINEVENTFKKKMDEEKAGLDSDPSDPSAGLMKLMKQMYDEGDDDMKRTIAKSWYESRNKGTTDVDMKSDDSLNI